MKKLYEQGKLVNGATLVQDTVFGINDTKITNNLINVGEGKH